MSKHDNALDDRQFPEHDGVKKDRHNYDSPCEQGSLPGVNCVTRICKDDDSLDLLACSITSACQRGVPA